MDYAQITTETEEEFVQGSVIILTSLINATILQNGACLLGLSGGSTPKKIYTELGKSDEIDWSKVWVCLVDERYVPADDKDSNQKLVRETLLQNAGVPEQNLIFPDTAKPIEQSVAEYNTALENIKPDVLVLGMGPDGHIASLFPPVPDDATSREKHAIHTQTEQFAVRDRISLTLPTIQRAETKVFLLQGEEKKKVWEDMLASKEGKERWPAKAVLQESGVTVVNLWQ